MRGMRKVFIMAASIFAILAAVWGAGLVWFAAAIPDTVADPNTRTDAIVVLTGGSERIETGVKLLAQGLAERLYISGVGGPAKTTELIARATNEPQLGARIALGTAVNTPGNAMETAAWVHAQGIGSIRLVTAAYHMRRSLLELSTAMPGVAIIPHPVFPATVKSDWWRWPGTASLIAREYTKFAVTWAHHELGFDVETDARR